MRIVGCSIGAIGGTAAYALLVGVLVGLSHVSGATKFVGFATAAAWGGIVVAVAALCGFAPGRSGRVPVPTLPFAFFLRKLVRSSKISVRSSLCAALCSCCGKCCSAGRRFLRYSDYARPFIKSIWSCGGLGRYYRRSSGNPSSGYGRERRGAGKRTARLAQHQRTCELLRSTARLGTLS